jgi:hypothetical protein
MKDEVRDFGLDNSPGRHTERNRDTDPDNILHRKFSPAL